MHHFIVMQRNAIEGMYVIEWLSDLSTDFTDVTLVSGDILLKTLLTWFGWWLVILMEMMLEVVMGGGHGDIWGGRQDGGQRCDQEMDNKMNTGLELWWWKKSDRNRWKYYCHTRFEYWVGIFIKKKSQIMDNCQRIEKKLWFLTFACGNVFVKVSSTCCEPLVGSSPCQRAARGQHTCCIQP